MTDWHKHPTAKGFSRDVLEDPYNLASAATPTDAARIDWLEQSAAKGRTFAVSWCERERSTVEDAISYDIPAGFYLNDDDGPYPSLRAAIDASMRPPAAVDRGAWTSENEDGWRAGVDGRTKTDNPHTPNSPQWVAWNHGWECWSSEYGLDNA